MTPTPGPRTVHWLGRGSFYDDTEASLAVAGAPDQLHCFGYHPSRNVIDLAGRPRHVGFPRAVDILHSTFGRMPPAPAPHATCGRPTPRGWTNSVAPEPEDPNRARNPATPSATPSGSLSTIGASTPLTDRICTAHLLGSPRESHP